jgi:hypothetical protein
MNVKLIAGKEYDVENLVFAGWNVEHTAGIDGINVSDYFDDGWYLGPDVNGVEPLFRITAGDIDVLDAYQGTGGKDGDTPFGYVGITDCGGYFFEWQDTLEDTLDSLDPDECDEPIFDFAELAREVLEKAIGDDFERLHAAAYGDQPSYLCKFAN